MPQVTWKTYESNYAKWAGEQLDFRTLNSAGHQLDAAQFTADPTTGRKTIVDGTLVGRTHTEQENGDGFGPADLDAPDDQIFIVAVTVPDADRDPSITTVREGTVVYVDQLPEWSGLTSPQRDVVRSVYASRIARFA